MVIEAAIVKNDISATVRDASISAVFRRPRSASGRLSEKCQLSFIYVFFFFVFCFIFSPFQMTRTSVFVQNLEVVPHWLSSNVNFTGMANQG